METNVSRRDFLKGSIVVALGAAGAATLSSCAGGDAAVATAPDTAAKTATLHRGYGAAHGDKCFTSVVVATAEDGTILAASVDDYQFMPADSAGITPVPNSDAGFADGYAEGKVLMSKTVNNDAYSASMKEKAQSTTPWLTSMKAIEAYCVGKKASDLTKTSLDAVTGATLVDAPNYLKLVSEVAGSDDITTTGARLLTVTRRSRKPFPLCRGTCWLLRASTSSSSPTLRLPAWCPCPIRTPPSPKGTPRARRSCPSR